MQYEPKLKKAMEEIKNILKSNDIAGVVILHSPGFSEYINHLQTSYSCAQATLEGIRIKLSSKEVGKEKAKLLAEGTYNMITHLADITALHAMAYMEAQESLKKTLGGEEFPGEHTSHDQQNN